MSISTASSFIPQLIHTIGSNLSWNEGAVISSTLEAAFYGSLKGGMQNTGRVLNWIRETSISHVNKIQVLFNIANGAITFYFANSLTNEILERFAISQIFEGEYGWVLKSISIAPALGIVTFLGVLVINRFSPPLKAPQSTTNQTAISATLSTQQKIAKVLHIAKLALSVALACFAQNQMYFAISLVGTTYSLWKNLQLKWLTFSRTINLNLPPIYKADQTYHMFALPPSSTKDQCSICLEEDVETSFCAKHAYHEPCISELIEKKDIEFIQNANLRKIETKHYQNGVYTHSNYHWEAKIPENDLPNCAMCRDFPAQNTLELKIHDTEHGKLPCNVTIVKSEERTQKISANRQKIFENLYAIYNVAQAGLAYLQTYPELAASIFNIQELMIFTDLIAYAASGYLLTKKIGEKLKLQNSLAFKAAAVAVLVAAAAASYFAILQINAYLTPALDLKDLLKQLPIPAQNGIEISWNAPYTLPIIQCLYLSRMTASIALAVFSSQRKANLLSAACQLFSLIGISNLKWMEFGLTLAWPLKKINEEGGNVFLSAYDLKSLTLTTYSLIDPKNLQSNLQAIYNHATSFFNNSSWSRHWLVSYKNGIEISRKLVYTITLQNNSLVPSLGTFFPSLVNYSINLIDNIYGAADYELA
jgi:hypothetical protein